MKMKTRLLALTAVAAIIAMGTLGVVFVVSAQEDGGAPARGRQEQRDAFLERVAASLGVDVARLEDAIKQARLAAVDDALAAGSITDERAAKARERIESGEGPRRLFKERIKARHDRVAKIRGGIIEASATALGISADELKTELKAGKSIAEVASERAVNLDDVKAEITSAADGRLDQAVANGRITRERADELLQQLTERLDELLNKKRTPGQ